MKAIKNIYSNLDLYGTDVLLTALKTNYSHVSFTKEAKTVPTEGSQCIKAENFAPKKNFEVEKLIFHKSGAVTVKTTFNHYFQFINLKKLKYEN